MQDGRIMLSNVVASQAQLHAPYGGVFPEVASREHVLKIGPVVKEALEEANLAWNGCASKRTRRSSIWSGEWRTSRLK